MQEKEFSLLEEPWIAVVGTDDLMKKVSLTQALLQAHEIRDLAGESRTQDSAVLRLLLAVVHTVFSRMDERGQTGDITGVPEAVRRWGALWESGAFPEKPIREYLEEWKERFWLFHPERPFYQIKGLQGTNNSAKKLNGALVESNNKIQLFSLWNGERKNRLSYDEAARWLVFIQGFGDTAAKKPSPKRSWLGNIGLVMAKGNNLFETLMLNLMFLKDGIEPWENGCPSWEKDPAEEKLRQIPVPDNQAELLTVQCRRILLEREGEWVVSYVEAAGDYFPVEDAFSEQMTLWRANKKRDKIIGYYPQIHQPDRQMWRDFSVLMGRTVRKPGIVAWIGKLKSKNILEKSRMISFQIVGVQYGNMSCGIQDDFSDQLQMYSGLLEDLGANWQTYVADEVEDCEVLSTKVGRLAFELDRAVGGQGGEMEKKAKEQCFYRLDVPFRQWLLAIDPDANPKSRSELRKTWKGQAKQIALDLGYELVEQSGTAGLIGRTVKEKEKLKHYCAPKAFNRFLSELKRWEEGKK